MSYNFDVNIISLVLTITHTCTLSCKQTKHMHMTFL